MSEERLGNYVLEHCIGDGGMGRVHKGVHRETGQPVAIKILHAELAQSAEMVERFLREGQAANRVQHPGVVKILDSGLTDKELPYLVMEYLQGQPLSDYLRQRSRPPLWEVLRIGQELAASLSAAHAQSVVHRDLKPENIFLLGEIGASSWPHLKILDFGIAMMAMPKNRKRLTVAGAFLGTPCYMAKEVVLDPRNASERSDAYALGVILYQMLVGNPPFDDECPSAVLFKQVNAEVPLLESKCADAPPLLCKLVNELLSKQPERRPTMIEVFQALLYIERGAPSALSLSKSRRGNLIRRSIAWIAPSLFVCAGAMAITHAPRDKAAVRIAASLPPTEMVQVAPPPPPIAPPPAAPIEVTPPPLQVPHWPGLPSLRLANEQPITPPSPRPEITTAAPREIPQVAPPPFDAHQVFLDAKRAFMEGRYGDAIAGAEKVIRDKPYDAWQLIGRAACKKGDRQLAQKALRRLEPSRQPLVLYECGNLLD